MTDHADTIRPESYKALAVRLNNTRVASADTCEQVAAAITVLLAERQQAIDERDAAREMTTRANRENMEREQALNAMLTASEEHTQHWEARCEQAIDALREIVANGHGEEIEAGCELCTVTRIARAALVSLGEQP